MKWETIEIDYADVEDISEIKRICVPGGWIYKINVGLFEFNTVFVPRPLKNSF